MWSVWSRHSEPSTAQRMYSREPRGTSGTSGMPGQLHAELRGNHEAIAAGAREGVAKELLARAGLAVGVGRVDEVHADRLALVDQPAGAVGSTVLPIWLQPRPRTDTSRSEWPSRRVAG